MKLGIGLPAIFISVAAGIHGALVLYWGALAQDDHVRSFGYALMLIALLLLFGGAFALETMSKAKKLFIAAFIVAVVTLLFISYNAAVWVVLTLILTSLSEKAEPSRKRIKSESA